MYNNSLIVLVICVLLNLCVFTHLDAQEISGTSKSASDFSIGKEIKEFLTNLNGELKLNF